MPAISRARTEDQKHERERTLLAAAWVLFQEHAFDTISVAQIAATANVAKGTVFLYFASKEALFLAVLRDKLEAWFAELNQWLDAAPERTTALLASSIANSLSAKPALLRLLAMLHNQLEPHAGDANIVLFKHFLLTQLNICGLRLERVFPQFTPGDGARILMRIYALVIGVQHLTLTDIGRRAIGADPALQIFDIDFERELRDNVQLLLDATLRR
jgi:AcrR family transcriptional regulator